MKVVYLSKYRAKSRLVLETQLALPLKDVLEFVAIFPGKTVEKGGISMVEVSNFSAKCALCLDSSAVSPATT